jgi:hypothetical protein
MTEDNPIFGVVQKEAMRAGMYIFVECLCNNVYNLDLNQNKFFNSEISPAEMINKCIRIFENINFLSVLIT